MSREDVLGCQHGRPFGALCPHCMGKPVEPARAEAPQGETASFPKPAICPTCEVPPSMCACQPAAQTETGDRGQGLHPITAKWIDAATKLGEGLHDGVIDGAVREALQAGRAAENEACEKLARERYQTAEAALVVRRRAGRQGNGVDDGLWWKRDEADLIADAIAARRGGKP